VQVIRVILAGVALLWMQACGGLWFFRRAGAGPSDCPARSGGHARLELRDPRYDGETLSGLILIGAEEGTVCLDKSRLSTTHLDVDWVWDCTSGVSSPVASLMVDYYATPRRKEDIVVLEPGYWFGGPVHIPLFVKERPGGKPNPTCVEVSLSLLPLEGGPAGRVRIRALRDPPVAPEGGVPAAPEPTLQGGSAGPVGDPDKNGP
jgi:hypothetical protein